MKKFAVIRLLNLTAACLFLLSLAGCIRGNPGVTETASQENSSASVMKVVLGEIRVLLKRPVRKIHLPLS